MTTLLFITLGLMIPNLSWNVRPVNFNTMQSTLTTWRQDYCEGSFEYNSTLEMIGWHAATQTSNDSKKKMGGRRNQLGEIEGDIKPEDPSVMNCSSYEASMTPAPGFVCMPDLPSLAARLNKAPDVPGYLLGSQAFFGRSYSMSNDGWVMAWGTLVLTVLLEFLSADAVVNICKKKGGTNLYLQGVLCNFVNNAVFGPPLYELVSNRWMSEPFTALGRVAMVLAILVGHSIGYYCAHRWMHTRRMYWAHRFHHRFNVYVVPVTANAVSLAEYALAYMLPFVAGAALLCPDRMSMFVAISIVSLNNLLVHTPKLADVSVRVVPWLFVSTADHLDHHKRLTTHYAAPTFSVDRILSSVAEQVKERTQKKTVGLEATPIQNQRGCPVDAQEE